jgi:hypothetical protein
MWDPVDSLAPLFRQLDGRFSFFACDGEHFVAATDIFGAGSLYFSRSDSGVCIATHLGLLLAAQGTVVHDEAAAIRCFLMRGTSFGETPFRGASRLAGCHFIAGSIKHGGTPRFEIRPYGRLEDLLALAREDPCQPEDDRSPQDHLDQLFSESLVREQYGKKAIVTLSAGNDSRFVALQFQRHLDLKPRTLTAGSDMVFDSDYIKADLVAKRLGLQNTRTGWDLSPELTKKISLLGGGIIPLESAKWLALAQAAPDDSILVNGFLGGVLSGKMVDYSASPTNPKLQILFPGLNCGIPITAVFQQVEEEFNQLSQEIMRRLAELEEFETWQSMELLNLQIRQAGWVSGVNLELTELVSECSTPFFYRPLISFFLGLPRSLRSKAGLYREWLIQHGGRDPGWIPYLTRGLWGVVKSPIQSRQYSFGLGTGAQMRVRANEDWLTQMVQTHFKDDELLGQLCLKTLKLRSFRGMPATFSALPMGIARGTLSEMP